MPTISTKTPSLQEYRTYVSDPKNKGTTLSTSLAEVKTAPQDFFGHKMSFLLGKTNAQEVEAFHQALIEHYGPSIADFAFPLEVRQQASASNLEGAVQQHISKGIENYINPRLRRFTLSPYAIENREEPKTRLERHIIKPTEDALRRARNGLLSEVAFDLSLSTETLPVGLTHECIKQVLEHSDDLVKNAKYIQLAGAATAKIADSLQKIDTADQYLFPPEKPIVSKERLIDLNTRINELAKSVVDIQQNRASLSAAESPYSDSPSSSLQKAGTDISKNIEKAHLLLVETKALSRVLKELKRDHDQWDEIENRPLISFQKYDFEKFIDPAKELLREASLLGQDTINHLCSPPISPEKEAKLKTFLQQNKGIERKLQQILNESSQLKQKLQSEVKSLVQEAEKRSTEAEKALSTRTLSDRLLFRSDKNKQDALKNAEFNLKEIQAIAKPINNAIEEAKNALTSDNWAMTPFL